MSCSRESLIRGEAGSGCVARAAGFAPSDSLLATIVAYRRTAAVAYVMARLGARVVGFGHPADLTLAWETGTWITPADARRLPLAAINRGCVDISKTTVDRLWAEAAGYSIAVDPLTFDGPIVVKPDRNGVRGGRIVNGPVRARERGFVYQRLVDCREGDEIHTTRPAIIAGRIVVVYEKRRQYPEWFAGREKVKMAHADDVYSADEQVALLRFCSSIGMEYGELDVVRDKGSGLIYVVDANRTPVRPKGLPVECEDEAFGPMAAAFAELLKRGGDARGRDAHG
jgi:hypothetical protein